MPKKFVDKWMKRTTPMNDSSSSNEDGRCFLVVNISLLAMGLIIVCIASCLKWHSAMSKFLAIQDTETLGDLHAFNVITWTLFVTGFLLVILNVIFAIILY